jgi:site-specific DNA-methyltransferase (adenine-specific)
MNTADFENKVVFGDCIEVLSGIKEEVFDMVLTSPPYDNLRTYEDSLIWSEDIWKKVIELLYKVLKKGGVVVWIVNDATIDGSETGTSFKQALYFKEVGFNIHDTMIWEKPNFSNPSNNRYHQIFEYMFVFSKGKPKTFNPIKDKKNKYLTSFGKSTYRKANGEIVERNKKIGSEWGMRTNIWKINTVGQEMIGKTPPHPAMFPESLAKDHILSWSNEGDLVLDPFAGSGTTGLVAYKLNRKFFLIEKVQKYYDICCKRVLGLKNNSLF